MADKKVLVSLNLNGNEVKKASWEKLATAPVSPFVGQYYYNTTDNRVYYWNGTKWISGVEGALVPKGTIGATHGDYEDLPTTDVEIGDTYVVADDGEYDGQKASVGDFFFCNANNPSILWSYVPSGNGVITFALVGDGTTAAFSNTNQLGSTKVTATLYDAAGAVVIADVVVTASTITVTFATAPAVGENYTLVVMGG